MAGEVETYLQYVYLFEHSDSPWQHANYQYRTCVIASICYSKWISQPISKISNSLPMCKWKQPNTFCWTLRWVFQKKICEKNLNQFFSLCSLNCLEFDHKATYMRQNLSQNDNEKCPILNFHQTVQCWTMTQHSIISWIYVTKTHRVYP